MNCVVRRSALILTENRIILPGNTTGIELHPGTSRKVAGKSKFGGRGACVDVVAVPIKGETFAQRIERADRSHRRIPLESTRSSVPGSIRSRRRSRTILEPPVTSEVGIGGQRCRQIRQ